MKLLKICLMIVLLKFTWNTGQAFALEENIKNYRGIRSSGMGGVLFTTGNYTEALFGNPARHTEVDVSKFTIAELLFEVNSNLISDTKSLSNFKGSSSGQNAVSSASSIIGKNEHARVQLFSGYFNPRITDEWGFGVGFLTSVQTNLLINYTTDVDTQTLVDAGPVFGLSRTFLNEALSIGMNLRLLYRLGADTSISSLDFLTGSKISLKTFGKQGTGIDGDLGGYYHIPLELTFMRLAAGLTLSNLVQSHYDEIDYHPIANVSTRPSRNDRTLNLGLRTDFPDTDFFKASLLALELQSIGSTLKRNSFYKRLHFGGETRILKYLLIRGGLNQGYLTGGLGIDLPVLKLDFATYGEELAGNAGVLEDRRYILRLSFEI